MRDTWEIPVNAAKSAKLSLNPNRQATSASELFWGMWLVPRGTRLSCWRHEARDGKAAADLSPNLLSKYFYRSDEQFLRNNPPSSSTSGPGEDLRSLVHELRVYQAELEVQHEELQDTKDALERSRDSYHSMFELAPVGYLTLAPSGLILDANRQMCKQLGFSRQELKGRAVARILRESDQVRFRRHLQRAVRHGLSQGCELVFRRKGGDELLARVQTSVLPDGVETTRLIRQWEQGGDRHIPVVAMTAHAVKGDRERFLAAGMDDYVSKPIRAATLFATIERATAVTPGDDRRA